MERGYPFSPTKCAVISNDSAPKRLYGSDLPKVKSFCYFGIDFTACGIDEIGHAKHRAAKDDGVVKSLARLGVCSPVLSARSLVQLFKSLVRPGLLPLLMTKKGALVISENYQLKLLKQMLNKELSIAHLKALGQHLISSLSAVYGTLDHDLCLIFYSFLERGVLFN